MKVKSDHGSKFFPIEAIARKKPEKYQGFNGIQTRELCVTVRCWTNWAVKPHIGSEVNLLSSLGARSVCWVKHRTGIVEVTGLNPVEALIFFRLLPSICWNWKIYCDDHSSLSSLICKQFLKLSETSETVCQDSNLLVDTSLVDIPYTIFDTSTCAVSVTKSCTISFYAFFFSSYKACSFFGTLIH